MYNLEIKVKVILLLLFVGHSTLIYSQVENSPPPPPPPPKEGKETVVKFMDVEVEETVIEEPVFEDHDVEEESSGAVYNSTYQSRKTNSRYNTSTLYGEYELVYEKYGNDSYNRTYGILKQGELLLPIIFKSQSSYGSSSKFKILGLGDSYGLYNLETENWTIPLEYSSLNNLSKNLYTAKKGQNAGIVDESNNVITAFKWSSISGISGLENYVYVTTKKLKGIYSIIANKVTVQPKYKSIYKNSDENYFKVQNEFDEYNIIDINGKPRFKTWYKELTAGKGGRKYYIVKEEGKMGIIDENEKFIVPLNYQYIKNTPYNDGSYLARNKKGKYGCISIDGNVTLPFDYDNLDIMGYGNIAISGKGNKCGIVQVNNGLPFEIATCDFDDISKSSKAFIVKQNKKFGVMDLYGKMKTKLEFNEINSISNDLLVARKKDDWLLMNNNGETLTDKTYKKIEPLVNHEKQGYYSSKNFSYLQVKYKNGKYGIIDKVGNEIVGPIFEDLLSESKNIVQVKNNGKFGLFNLLTKKEILPYEYDQITSSKKGYYVFKGKDIYLITDPGKMNLAKQ